MTQSIKKLHGKRIKMWNESISNHYKYIDKNYNLFESKWVEHKICPVCEKDNYIKIFKKKRVKYVKFLECSIIYLNPAFTNDALINYYQNNHAKQSKVMSSDTDNFYVNLYNKELESIEKNSKLGITLDIRCSSRAFLDIAKKIDRDTSGVEFNCKEFKLAQNKDHTAYNGLFKNVTFREKLLDYKLRVVLGESN